MIPWVNLGLGREPGLRWVWGEGAGIHINMCIRYQDLSVHLEMLADKMHVSNKD